MNDYYKSLKIFKEIEEKTNKLLELVKNNYNENLTYQSYCLYKYGQADKINNSILDKNGNLILSYRYTSRGSLLSFMLNNNKYNFLGLCPTAIKRNENTKKEIEITSKCFLNNFNKIVEKINKLMVVTPEIEI